MDDQWSVAKRQAQRRRWEGEWEPLEVEIDTPLASHKTVRTKKRTPAGTFGAAVLFVAIVALTLNFTLPWVVIQFDPSVPGVGALPDETLGRSDLGGSSAYADRLLGWPLATFIVTIIAGTCLAGIDHLDGLYKGTHRAVQSLLLLVIAFFGFLLTLTGTRWLGAQTTSLLSGDGSTTVILHANPYLNLGVGILLLAGALYHVRRPLQQLFIHDRLGLYGERTMRATGLMVAACAGCLLLMPLLPFVASNTQSAYLGEWDLAAITGRGGDLLENADRALGWVRAMTWVVLYLFLAAFLKAAARRARGGRQETPFWTRLPGLAVVPLLIMIVFTVLFYTRLGATENVSMFPNPFLPLGVLALLLAYTHWVNQVLRPGMRNSKPVAARENPRSQTPPDP